MLEVETKLSTIKHREEIKHLSWELQRVKEQNNLLKSSKDLKKYQEIFYLFTPWTTKFLVKLNTITYLGHE